jgi:hypothetical protein
MVSSLSLKGWRGVVGQVGGAIGRGGGGGGGWPSFVRVQVGRWGRFQTNSIGFPRGTAWSPRQPGRDHQCQHRSHCGKQGRGILLVTSRRRGLGQRHSHRRRRHPKGGTPGRGLQRGKGGRSSERERPGQAGQACCWSVDAGVAEWRLLQHGTDSYIIQT